MSVKYILTQVGDKVGLNPSNDTERNVMLRWVREAVIEVYDQSDPPGSLVEGVYRVNGDQTISLPANVGSPRAMRELNSQMPWHVNKLRPRYNQFNWKDAWRNFRLKNKQALMASVTNQSVGIITVPFVEDPPITISVSGPTLTATNANEDIVMDAITKNTTNQYTDYNSVKKDRVNNYDVTLSDVDGKLLTIIPNNVLAALYQIIDVSQCPWLQVTGSTFDNYLEVLFKLTLPILTNDNDEFFTGEYDDIIVNKVLQLWSEEQGKADSALAYDAKASRSLARKEENQNRETEDEVALIANTHDTIQRRIGIGTRRRWGTYNGWGR